MADASTQFVQFLKGTGLPESLWVRLLDQIDAGQLGCDGCLKVICSALSRHQAGCTECRLHANEHGCALQAVQRDGECKVVAEKDLAAENQVWLLPHVIEATRPGLKELLDANSLLVETCSQVLQLEGCPPGTQQQGKAWDEACFAHLLVVTYTSVAAKGSRRQQVRSSRECKPCFH